MHETSTRRLSPLSCGALAVALVAALCGSIATADATLAQANQPSTPLVADRVIFDPVAEGYDDSLEALQVDSNGTVAAAVVEKDGKHQAISIDLVSGDMATLGRLTAAEPRILLSDDGSTLALQYLTDQSSAPATTFVLRLSNGRNKRLSYTGFLHGLSSDGKFGSGLGYDAATERLAPVLVNMTTGVTTALPALAGPFNNTSISGDGTVIAAYTNVGRLYTINLDAAGSTRWANHGKTHAPITRLDGQRFWNTSVSMSFDGSLIAYQGTRPTVKNLTTGARTVSPATQDTVIGYDIDISPDGRLVSFGTRAAISPYDSDDENFDGFTGFKGTGDVYVWNTGNDEVTWASLRHDLDSIGGGGRSGNLIGSALNELVYSGQASAAGNSSSTRNTVLHSRPLLRSDATCGGQQATVLLILGEKPTGGDDIILGTAANDAISAGPGDDIICGASGNDNINAGSGDDIIFDGADDDTVNAGPGNDTIQGYGSIYFRKICSQPETYIGGDGDDLIIAVAHNPHVDDLADCPALRPLRIDGGSGKDTVRVTGGPFTVLGGAGNDTLVSSDTTNGFISGGAGNDTITGATKANGGTGNDKITGTRGLDELLGGKGNDTIDGSKGDDFIHGGGGKDRLKGGGGADVIKGGKGRDTIDGGPGSDSCVDTRNTKFTKCEVRKRR